MQKGNQFSVNIRINENTINGKITDQCKNKEKSTTNS